MKPLRCDTPTDIYVHIRGQEPYWLCVPHLVDCVVELVAIDLPYEIRKLGAREKGTAGVKKGFKWKCQRMIEESVL